MHDTLDPDETGAAERIGKGRIGRIVAGSLTTGFVAALVLVLGPFGGSQEHVIMGTMLLGWAAGWALLAVLLRRWTRYTAAVGWCLATS